MVRVPGREPYRVRLHPHGVPGAPRGAAGAVRLNSGSHGGLSAGRPQFFTTAYFHTPDGLADEIEQAGFTGVAVYGVEGPGWPLHRQWTDPRRREHILFAARSAETQPSLIGFSHHLIAAATTAQTSSRAADERISGLIRLGR